MFVKTEMINSLSQQALLLYHEYLSKCSFYAGNAMSQRHLISGRVKDKKLYKLGTMEVFCNFEAPYCECKNMVLWVAWNFFYLFKTCCQDIFSTI